MAIRSSSPVSESLLWKARLLQHNAQLQREKDAFKTQIKELTEHVTYLDASVKAVTNLSDRVAVVEEDDQRRQEAFVTFDADRSKKLRLMEEKYEGMSRKMNAVQEKVNELIDAHDERSRERDADTSATKRIGELDTKISGLYNYCNALKAETISANDAMFRETRSFHVALQSLAKKVEEVAARPLDATSVLGQVEQPIILDRNHGAQMTAKMAAPKATRLPQSSTNLSKSTSVENLAVSAKAKQSPAGITKSKAVKQPAKQKCLPGQVIRSDHPGHRRQEDCPDDQKQLGLNVAPKWRLRTTRAGPSGWSLLRQPDRAQVSQDNSRHPPLQDLADKVSGGLLAREIMPLNKKQPREEGKGNGRDCEEGLNLSSPLPIEPEKRAQTLRSAKNAKGATAVRRSFLDPNQSVAANVAHENGQRQPISTEQAAPSARTRLGSPKDSVVSKLDAEHQLSRTAERVNQRAKAQPTILTDSRVMKRRRARIPNLPPTPPPPSP